MCRSLLYQLVLWRTRLVRSDGFRFNTIHIMSEVAAQREYLSRIMSHEMYKYRASNIPSEDILRVIVP